MPTYWIRWQFASRESVCIWQCPNCFPNECQPSVTHLNALSECIWLIYRMRKSVPILSSQWRSQDRHHGASRISLLTDSQFLLEAAFFWNILANPHVYLICSLGLHGVRLQDMSAIWRSVDGCSAAPLAFQWLKGDGRRVSRYREEAVRAWQRRLYKCKDSHSFEI